MNPVYASVIKRIIKSLSDGVAPWKRPWNTVAAHNAESKRAYSGVNALLLNNNPDGPGFLTKNQIHKLGGSLKSNARYEMIVWMSSAIKKKKNTNDDDDDAQTSQVYRYMKYFWVYPVSHTVGLPDKYYEKPAEIVYVPGEADALVDATGAAIEYGGNRACYSHITDVIRVPKRDEFVGQKEFLSTMFHELSHWTGHKSRLNRKLSNAFGSPAYAKEELIAEISAAFICATCGINIEGGKTPDDNWCSNSAAYCQNWGEALKKSDLNRHIASAASRASKAADFILAFKPEKKDEVS